MIKTRTQIVDYIKSFFWDVKKLLFYWSQASIPRNSLKSIGRCGCGDFPRPQKASDFPVHWQYVKPEKLKTQEYITTLDIWSGKHKMKLNEKKTKILNTSICKYISAIFITYKMQILSRIIFYVIHNYWFYILKLKAWVLLFIFLRILIIEHVTNSATQLKHLRGLLEVEDRSQYQEHWLSKSPDWWKYQVWWF